MRQKFVAGNWKMNLDAAGAVALASGLKEQLSSCENAEKVKVAVCPPFVYLTKVAEAVAGSQIGVGGQNLFSEGNGAFTGEISVEMLKDTCCEYVIIGHSERRHVIGETDEIINKKIKAALNGALKPIFCIGELLEEREANQTETVLERQIREGLAGMSKEQMAAVTVAYEPVWAIGTGKTATPEQAQDAHAYTRKILGELFGEDVAEATVIQYGGSVKPGNAAELMSQADVDGALVGGASLKVDDFMGIIKAAIEVSRGTGGECGCNCACGM